MLHCCSWIALAVFLNTTLLWSSFCQLHLTHLYLLCVCVLGNVPLIMSSCLFLFVSFRCWPLNHQRLTIFVSKDFVKTFLLDSRSVYFLIKKRLPLSSLHCQSGHVAVHLFTGLCCSAFLCLYFVYHISCSKRLIFSFSSLGGFNLFAKKKRWARSARKPGNSNYFCVYVHARACDSKKRCWTNSELHTGKRTEKP